MTFTNDYPNALIIAAEASSALYAQRLLETWGDKRIHCFGIGSREMEKIGFECIGRSEEMAVVGVQEVLKHYPMIRRVFKTLVAECKKRKPKFILLLDYPEFNLKLAKELHPLGIPIIYYISPQIWAWRRERIKQMQKYMRKVLVIFPFEKEFYESHSVDCDFVGHPLLDEISPDFFESDTIKNLRKENSIPTNKLVLGLLPGSRNSEIQHHFEIQMQTAKILANRYPELHFVLLAAPGLNKEQLRSLIPEASPKIQILQSEPFEMLRCIDVALVASGTATLMTGLMRKPMVIMYIMNPVSAWIARRFVKTTRFFGMINLIFNRKVAEELFQEEANPENLAAELSVYIEREEVRRAKIEELKSLPDKLGTKGATQRVAQVLEEFL